MEAKQRIRAQRPATLDERVLQYLEARIAFYAHADLRHDDPKQMNLARAVKADGRRFAAATVALLSSAGRRRGQTTPLVIACGAWMRAYRAAQKIPKSLNLARDYERVAAKMNLLYETERRLFELMGKLPSRHDPAA